LSDELKLQNWTYDVGVVGGAGHVGLPLALMFAANGRRTLIQDINEASLDIIGSGVMPHMEHDAEDYLTRALNSGNLTLTTDVEQLAETRVIIVTIGTPVDEFLNPVYGAIKDCLDSILPHLSDDQLIVLRSTVFPGTSEWLHQYLRRDGRKTLVSFCPERVTQGHAIREIQGMPQIVSGTTPEAEQQAEALFADIAPEVVRMTPTEAEFAKLFANAYRYVQFATANQFYMIAKEAGLDYSRIREGLVHNYERAKDLPRAGFAAGPCLFKDTMQLSAFANNQFSLGHDAMLINEGLVLHVIDDIRQRYDISTLTVGLLGMAFKADCDDTRASLSYKMKHALQLHAAEVLTTDPYVTSDPELLSLEEVIARSDILVLCTPHSDYRELQVTDRPIVDIWGVIATDPNEQYPSQHASVGE